MNGGTLSFTDKLGEDGHGELKLDCYMYLKIAHFSRRIDGMNPRICS